MGPIDPQERRRAWLTAGLTAAALLFVPFLVWLVLPAPPKIPVPQVIAATNEPEPPPRPAPSPRPSSPRPPPAPEPTAAAEEAGPVRGTVLAPDGSPLSRAWVGCTDRELATTSDRDGSYELPPEAAGCTGQARKPGYGSSDTATLHAGSPRSNTLQLLGGGRIEGNVVDEGGHPVTRFMLAVEKFVGAAGDDEGSNGRARTIEDERGHFLMENATPGQYVLTASADGRPPARSDPLDVQPGRSVTGVRIVLAKGGVLRGVITDVKTRTPLEGARVALDALTSTGVSTTPSVKTDAAGKYELGGVPTGGPFS
ncbi:MAG: carboxypeptidase regulatory-like domain-containing protein, partial [Polyangiaceae bacterium]